MRRKCVKGRAAMVSLAKRQVRRPTCARHVPLDFTRTVKLLRTVSSSQTSANKKTYVGANLHGFDLTGIDASGEKWHTFYLRRTTGRLENCPDTVPPYYHCVNSHIVGPHVNINGFNLTGVIAYHWNIMDFKGVYGTPLKCPDSLPRGLECTTVSGITGLLTGGEPDTLNSLNHCKKGIYLAKVSSDHKSSTIKLVLN